MLLKSYLAVFGAHFRRRSLELNFVLISQATDDLIS